jgi:hemerythrin-like domain-containing protein
LHDLTLHPFPQNRKQAAFLHTDIVLKKFQTDMTNNIISCLKILKFEPVIETISRFPSTQEAVMQTQERTEVFINVHKGLRQALFGLGLMLGKADWDDHAEVFAVETDFKKLLHFLREHATNEDDFSFPLLESRSEGATQAEREEHRRLDAELNRLEADFILLKKNTDNRWKNSYEFYRAFNRFLSGYLAHMEREEGFITETLYQHFTDEEIEKDIQKIIQRTSPADMGMMLGYMIPGMNPDERFKFISKLKKNAPPEVFGKVKGLAQNVLAEPDWKKLSEKLELV